MTSRVPNPSQVICSGKIEDFYRNINACNASKVEFVKSCDCSYWILYIQKCLINQDSNCIIEKEWARGRVSKGGVLLGLDSNLVIPDLNDVEEDGMPSGWSGNKCGSSFQKCDNQDENDNSNKYLYYYIRVYDYISQNGSYIPFMVNGDSNPVPPNCECIIEPPLPTYREVVCNCSDNCPDIHLGFVREEDYEAEMIRCKNIAESRECCITDYFPKPPIRPPKPPGGSGEENWGQGGDGVYPDWGWEEGIKPSWPGSGSESWNEGGSPIYPGGPSRPTTPPGNIYPPDPNEVCNAPTIIVKCPKTEYENLRIVDNNIVLPIKKNVDQNSDIIDGLVDATFFTMA